MPFIGDTGQLSNIYEKNYETATLRIVEGDTAFQAYNPADSHYKLITNLQEISEIGAVTDRTIQFTNVTTSFTTTSNAGISNTNPVHTLDIGSNVQIDDVGSNTFWTSGTVYATNYAGETATVTNSVTTRDVLIDRVFPKTNGFVQMTSNVGIITSTPSYTLDVDGDINFTGTLYDNGVAFSGGGGGGIDTTQTLALTNAITGLTVSSNAVVTGNVTASVFLGDGGLLSNIESQRVYTLGVNGSSDYIFQGPGFDNPTNDPVLRLIRGFTYIFDNSSNYASHPFKIRTGINGTDFTSGVVDNSAGITTFTVPMDAPPELYYQCSVHTSMGNKVHILKEYSSTDDIPEGSSNLYYTDAKVDSHLNTSSASSGQVLSWTGSDYAWAANGSSGSSYWLKDPDTLYYNTSNVGIGTTNASSELHVVGNVQATYFTGDGSALTNIQSSNVSNFASNVIRIDNLTTDLSSNASRIDNLTTDLSSNASRIDNLTTDLSSNASRIDNLTTDLSSNASRIDNLTTDLSSNASRIDNLTTDLDSNVTRIDNIITNLSSNASRIDNLTTDLDSNVTRIDNIITNLSSNASRIDNLTTDLDSNVTRIDNIITNLSSNASRIDNLTTDLDSNVTRIDNIITNLDSNVTKITNLRTDLDSNVTRIDNIITNLDSNVTKITNLRTDLDSNVTKITNLRTDLDSNVTRIENLESSDLTIDGVKTFSSNLQVGTANLFVDTESSSVGVGTTTPAYTLDVNGDINFTGTFYQGGSPFVSSLWTSNVDTLYYNTSNVGIGNTYAGYELHVEGNVYATQDISAFSDARFKENVEPIGCALEKVCSIGGYTYNKIGDPRRNAGVLAQEVMEVLPEVVHGSEDTTYSVAYGNMVGLLIEAIKELKLEIDELKKSR
jgi:predicted  nucleic acid-binding Zn-ribbon protein